MLGTIGRGELWQLLAGALKFDTASVVYANGIFVLLALLPLHVRERGWYRKLMYWYYVAVNAVLVVAVNMSDCVYFRYTQKRFTADEIFFADNSNSVQLVGKFMAENWYLVLVAAALVALLAWGYGRKVREESLLSRGWAYYVGSTVIFTAGAGLSIAGMRGGMTRMTRPITLSNATLYTDDSGKANLILSNPFCILRTIGSAGSVNYKKYFTPEELPQHFTPVHPPADSAAVNLAGRNVMVFIMESMSAEHSAYLMPEVYAGRETKGFTPFLDSLMRGGLCFKRMYANGTRSIQAMPSVLGSIPSFRTPFVLMPQSLGESRQLPAILRGQGLFDGILLRVGIRLDGIRGIRPLGRRRTARQPRGLRRRGTAKAISTVTGAFGTNRSCNSPARSSPGHRNLSSPRCSPSRRTTRSSSRHNTRTNSRPVTRRLHKGVAYVDNAFRLFFERFGSEEWFRRTIFVFVADHVSSEKFAAETRSYPGNYHIIGFMYTPDGALRGQVGEVVQQLDIMPTLLGLLGNTESYFAFGRDVLNEPQRQQWSVSWDGAFQAVTNDGTIRFDDAQETPAASGAGESLLQDFRALVQQYYSHAEKKSYIVHD